MRQAFNVFSYFLASLNRDYCELVFNLAR